MYVEHQFALVVAARLDAGRRVAGEQTGHRHRRWKGSDRTCAVDPWTLADDIETN